MKLLVGLGNPGAKYARHRHNIGFMAVDAIAAAPGFTPWRSKFQGQVSEGRLGPEKVLLLKPGTFMNLSGDSVQAAARFYRIEPADIIVFHDELDLAPGKIRVKTGGGHAGHNGLRSLDAHIGPDFTRVRLGIGHPGDKRLVTNHVLGDFAKAEAEWLEPLLAGIAEAAPELLAGEPARFIETATRHLPKPEKPEPRAGTPKQEPAPAPEAAPEADDPRSLLQKLADRFR
ncbi:MAG TPA: aminoacyl-tRNA hydrolase [Amaricoccus sp.]|uniref:aminoacyl-tRNA hydrolase n=1 Tax=Amaricoccus sp. TaxID=1872485 RepID=UPI002C54840E|nr:aminoacyl-tRNA hydrolase [Amaricoccus sp.]HMQ93375.1 aminoacyl-tRNA hydrolase [Amaricoccus sp.]HMR51804.1 aminoacyl-tRNA hydrolase [Amaricoccus sp.]HMR59360.1 aminoacyl-tRNA hydrolase [Amaricoccus sp.]HMT99142.1 aminoacyl-tRNA hydrolase [Amaricoccus sp.]